MNLTRKYILMKMSEKMQANIWKSFFGMIVEINGGKI